MRLFQFLVASSAVTYPAFLAQKTDLNSLGKKKSEYNVPMKCTSHRDCPTGTACYKLYRDNGVCVLTMPK